MRCPRCGNENPESNRFCGMCGATLLAPTPTPVAKPPQSAAAPIPVRTEPPRAPETRRSAPATTTDDGPSISGPSFLGLNAPPPARDPRKRVSLSIDPHSAHPGNVDYLLEDDEEPRRSGAWKYFFILIALALAIGFGYLRWKNQGLAWLMAAKKPAAATTNTPPGDTATPAATPSITPDTQPAPASQAAASTTTPAPDGNAATNPAPNAATPAPSSAAAAAGTSTPTPSNTDAAKSPANAAPATETDKSATEKSTPPASDSAAGSTDGSADADSKPAEAPKPAARKEPAPKPRPSTPIDTVAEARKYLYGTGAAQDCDRGMRLLKPAANQGNAKAMVEMGALYSAGLCTPHDLPTAYRWFALALRKEPDNTAVQSDLQKLWSEMTQPERQLAIKLSQ